MRLWLLILSAFAMCQATSQETAIDAFASIASRALRINGLGRVDPALAPWKVQFADSQARDSFLDSLRPTDDKNSKAWATYGYANEVLGQREQAILAYEQALNLRKTHSAVRLRLYLLNQDVRLLAPLRLSEYSLAGTLIANADAECVIDYLKTSSLQGREKANLAWVLPLTSSWRDEDYARLCQTMLTVPALAEEGFSRVYALQPEGDHLAAAQLACTAMQRAPRHFRAIDYGLPSSRWRSAASILLAQGETELATPALQRLYVAEPSKFLTHAEAYTDPRAVKRARALIEHRLQEVVDAWRARQLSIDLTPLFVETVSPALQDFALEQPDYLAWLEQLRARLDQSKFERTLHYLSSHDDLFWKSLTFFEEYLSTTSKFQDAIALANHPLLSITTCEDLAATIRLLKQSPFLDELATFRTFPRNDGEGSVFRDVVKRIRQQPSPQQRSFHILLSNLPSTFGRDFLMAVIEETPEPHLTALLDKHRSSIEALPQQQQTALAWEAPGMMTWMKVEHSSDGIDDFLAAETTALSRSQIQSNVRKWFKDLATSDRDRAREVFNHAVNLGCTPSDLIARIVSGTSSLEANILCLDFIAESDFARQSALPFARAILEAVDPEESDWEKALGTFFQRLTDIPTQEATIPLMTDGIWKALEAIADEKTERYAKMQSWFATDHFRSQHPTLAQWCHDLAGLHAYMLDDSKTASWVRMKTAIDGDSLSIAGSVAFAETLAAIFDTHLPPALLKSMSHALVSGLAHGLVTESQLHTTTKTFVQSDELPEKNKAKLANAWAQTLTGDSGDYGLGLILFELALQGNEATTITTIAEANDDQIDFNWLALTIRQGNTALAAEWLAKDWARFDWLHGAHQGPPPSFQLGDEQPIPELKDQPEYNFLAEALLLALPDPEDSESSTRKERLIGLANRLAPVTWKNADLEQTTLALVGIEPDAARHLNAHFQRLNKQIDIAALSGLDHIQERRRQQRLWRLAARTSLHEGPDTTLEQLSELLKLPEDGVRQFLQNLNLRNLETAFLSDWKLWDSEVFTANLHVLPLANDLDPDTWLSLGWAMRLLANDEANLVIPARVRRAKPDPQTGTSPKATFLQQVLTHVSEAMDKAALEEATRAEVAKLITQSPNFMRTLTALPKLHQSWFRYLQSERLLTIEALLENAAAFAKIAPRDGWAWVEAAKLHAAADKHADALSHWNSALPFIDKDPFHYSTIQLGRLETLFKLGLQGDAAKAIQGFDKKRLHPDFKVRWEALQKQLNVRPGGPASPVV